MSLITYMTHKHSALITTELITASHYYSSLRPISAPFTTHDALYDHSPGQESLSLSFSSALYSCDSLYYLSSLLRQKRCLKGNIFALVKCLLHKFSSFCLPKREWVERIFFFFFEKNSRKKEKTFFVYPTTLKIFMFNMISRIFLVERRVCTKRQQQAKASKAYLRALVASFSSSYTRSADVYLSCCFFDEHPEDDGGWKVFYPLSHFPLRTA